MTIAQQTTYQCSKCPATADVERDPNSTDGWMIAPRVLCADCVDNLVSGLDLAEKAESRS